MSKSIVLYLHMHQPYRIKNYSIFDCAVDNNLFNATDQSDQDNEYIFKRVAEKSYRPMNATLGRMLQKHPEFRFSLSITGSFIEQAEKWAPDILNEIKSFVKTGRVEILSETYNHSLSFFYNKEQFNKEVNKHRDTINRIFNYTPVSFRNTELAYNNDLAKWAEENGYKNIIAEGWDKILGWRSPNHIYKPYGTDNIRLLLKNYKLSDDLAFRFGDFTWDEWPLTSHKFAKWANHNSPNAKVINLFMDYETFGEHQWSDTGIFDFFTHFVNIWLQTNGNDFKTINEAADQYPIEGEISTENIVTWADQERDLSAWNGNSLQKEALSYIYSLSDKINKSKDEKLIQDWNNLLTSDHVYYMSTKHSGDGSVHSYFSPYLSPYDAFIYFMNACRDIEYRLNIEEKERL